tara:strand:- start:1283 stop:4159 length:2877 start_codon:yes stop_codon:yes gene_type:complete
MEVPPKENPRLFLIDAYALIYRAFFAFINRPLINSKGENTSALFGFTNFLIDIRDKYQPDYLAVVFDAGNSHREDIYPAYKATREKMPDELRASLPRIRELVAGFNDTLVELDGYEADDVIGTMAVKARELGLEAVIVSGDKDLYQLIGPGIHLLNPGRGGPTGVAAEWVDESNAHEKFGIPASQIVDYLALVGDSSDNIPGARGVGPKTALKLLEEYGSVEAILERAIEIPGKRIRESLIENADKVQVSKKLVTIMTYLDVELDLDALKVQDPDHEKLYHLFTDMEFRRLTDRFAPKNISNPIPNLEPIDKLGDSTEVISTEKLEESVQEQAVAQVSGFLIDHKLAECVLVTEAKEIITIVNRIRSEGSLVLEVHTAFPDPHRAGIAGIALSVKPGEVFYLSFGHVPPGDPELDFESPGIANLADFDAVEIQPLIEILEDPSIKKTGANLKYSAVALNRVGVVLRGIDFDITIASYVLDPNRQNHDLENICQEFLGLHLQSYNDVVGIGKKRISFAEVDQQIAANYAGQQVDVALRLVDFLAPSLEDKGLIGLFRKLEMALVPVLVNMECEGIGIDSPFFQGMSQKLDGDLTLIRREIYKVTGEEFNLNSTIQLREILFEKQGLPVIKKTKTGPSTDSSVLEELAAQGHDVPRLMMEYRELEKLRSTYVDAFPQLVVPRTGRIHARFNQTATATGRLSSSDPNLQNIPIRNDLGREIRKGFVPDSGHVFYGADYSQVELRILAHLSNDGHLVQAFRSEIDVHKQTASVIFDVALEEVTLEQRGHAKTINFATLYGQGAFSLAKQLGIGRNEAKVFIEEYFERFKGVRVYLDKQATDAQEKGFVETLMGRRRYIPELKSKNWNIRQFGERVAQNTPIQGTAADMTKKAMIDVAKGLHERGMESRLLIQVHDELLFEVPKGEEDALAELVVSCMENAMKLNVPLVAEGGIGNSWYETKS